MPTVIAYSDLVAGAGGGGDRALPYRPVRGIRPGRRAAAQDQRELVALGAGERGRVRDQPDDVGVQIRPGAGLPVTGRLFLPGALAGGGQRREAGGWRAGRLVIAVPLLIRTLMPG